VSENGWQIKQVDENIRFGGEWFGTNRASKLYIHQDGNARTSTEHNGIFSGYFATREAVEKAIAKYTHGIDACRSAFGADHRSHATCGWAISGNPNGAPSSNSQNSSLYFQLSF